MSIGTRQFAARAFVACAVALTVLACASSEQQEKAAKAENAANSLQATRTQISSVNTALDKAVATLTDLTQKPQADLSPQFAAYKAAVAELEAQAKTLGETAQAMRARGEEYFKSWEQDLGGINNPDLRQISADRRAKLSASYQKVTDGYSKAKAAFDPLLTELTDVQKVLGLDLTDNGLKMASNTAAEAKGNAETVKKELNGVSDELDKLAKVLSGAAESANK
jgi:hypothetical protein